MRRVANTPSTLVTLLSIDRTESKKKIRFAEQKIRFDFFKSTPTPPGRNLTRTFPKIEPKFGLQNLPIANDCNAHTHVAAPGQHPGSATATSPLGKTSLSEDVRQLLVLVQKRSLHEAQDRKHDELGRLGI